MTVDVISYVHMSHHKIHYVVMAPCVSVFFVFFTNFISANKSYTHQGCRSFNKEKIYTQTKSQTMMNMLGKINNAMMNNL